MNARAVADVVCMGEAMMLLTPADGRDLAWTTSLVPAVAGAESTVALYLADLGHSVAWLSRLGQDPLGDRVLEAVRAAGVDVEAVLRDPTAPTGLYLKDPGVERTPVYYYRSGSAASSLDPSDLERVDLAAARLVHLSGITPALSTSCAAASRELFSRAREGGGICSFDVNYRSGLWPVFDAAPALLDFAQLADVVLVGLDEAREVWGTETPDDVWRLIGGERSVVVKDSDVGATLFEDGTRTFVPAETVDVVEPVGAGDAFAAGYLSGLLRGWAPEGRLRLAHRVAGFALRSVADHADASSLRTWSESRWQSVTS